MLIQLLKDIKHYLLFLYRRARWHSLYPTTFLGSFNCLFPFSSVSIGLYTYGEINIIDSNPGKAKLRIGSFCSIAQGVTFILTSEHPTSCISTFPFKVMSLHSIPYEATSKGDIVVQDDVWLGYGSIILSGVTIGQGSVIAAGTVVTKDVLPYSIVAGVPARIIKYRFREEVINFFLDLDYNKLTKEMIHKNISTLYKSLTTLSIEEIKDLYSWFPKKNISNN